MKNRKITIIEIVKSVIFIALVIALNKAGAPGNAAFFAVLIVMTLRSPEGAIKAVALCMLTMVLNSAFVERSSTVFSPMRFGLPLLAAARFFYDLGARGRNPFGPGSRRALLAFVVIASILSLAGGYFVLVSQLKLLSFLVGTIAILAGTEVVWRRGTDLTGWFYSLIIFTVLAGIFAWVAGVGYNAKGEFGAIRSLFNGPFLHPNTLGPVCALLICYLTCQLLYTPFGRRSVSVALIVALFTFLYMSSSRTGMIAALAGIGASVFIGFFPRSGARAPIRLNISSAQIAGIVVGLAFAAIIANLVTDSLISESVKTFILKNNTSLVDSYSTALETLLVTRKAQIDMMLRNIEQKPWTGIGFGTSTHPFFVYHAGTFSAPTEKGILPLAILEETGIIGAAFFLLFLSLLYRELIIRHNLPGIGVLTTFLVCNLGEMGFFSFGGPGGISWVLAGAAILLGTNARILRKNPPRSLQPRSRSQRTAHVANS